jgi:hypothetical protein
MEERVGTACMHSLARASLVAAMEACLQAAGQSVLGHGRSVVAHFAQLRDHLEEGAPLASWWRVPAWTRQPGILDGLPSADVLAEYHEFHDCGKPGVLSVDAEGRRHFPDHAAASARTWLAVGGDPEAAALMAMDMDAHLLKAEGVAEFAARPQAVTLLLTALAEVHSNAAMFGGTDSDGFKIKAKQLDKRGAQVMALINAAAIPRPL